MTGSSGATPSAPVTREEEETLNHEVLFQVWTAQLAWANLDAVLKVPPELASILEKGPGFISGLAKDSEEFQMVVLWQVRIWTIVRMILSAAAVVSLTLWPITRRSARGPAEERRVARASELQRRWGLPADSILADRDVRDVFEHVDERLVEWLDEFKPSKMSGLLIDIVPPEGPPGDGSAFRIFDPQSKIVWAQGKRCDLGRLVEELKKVAEKLPAVSHRMELRLPKPE